MILRKIISLLFALAAISVFCTNTYAHRRHTASDSSMEHHYIHHEDAAGNTTAGHHDMHHGDMSSNATMTHHIKKTNFRWGLGPQHYPPFDVDISGDLFINHQRYMEFTGGGQFVDENGDGICDIVQNTDMFHHLGAGPCVDENGDSICDCFQTKDAYDKMGMKNFVDVDGDGICDNYELNPVQNMN